MASRVVKPKRRTGKAGGVTVDPREEEESAVQELLETSPSTSPPPRKLDRERPKPPEPPEVPYPEDFGRGVRETEDRTGIVLSSETAVLLLSGGVSAASKWRGVSPRTFRRFFERRGLTVTKYLIELRLTIGELLLRRELPVKEIARILAFSTESSFTRCWRREKGETVREAKRLMRRRR